jgi:hypothetical protein
MTISEALQLVKDKYFEEEKGTTTGKTTNKYRDACEQYPVLIATAQHIWAKALSKDLP